MTTGEYRIAALPALKPATNTYGRSGQVGPSPPLRGPGSARRTNCIDVDLDRDWEPARWLAILDRIEHRQPGVGLRFWGPPLWLEVTMTGPDSDHWPAISEQASAWDWRSSAACIGATALAAGGADDDELLAIVSRYTIENLILNAVHEIGEWFRFEGQRMFPAHLERHDGRSDGDDQGNGIVTVQVTFEPPHRSGGTSPMPSAKRDRDARLVRHLAGAVPASRFTYLPRTVVSYDVTGPVIKAWPDGEAMTAWPSTWSCATLEAAGVGTEHIRALVVRDVHRALVLHEADRICRAFHVDGERRWSLRVPGQAPATTPPDVEVADLGALSLSIAYSSTSAGPTNNFSQVGNP